MPLNKLYDQIGAKIAIIAKMIYAVKVKGMSVYL